MRHADRDKPVDQIRSWEDASISFQRPPVTYASAIMSGLSIKYSKSLEVTVYPWRIDFSIW